MQLAHRVSFKALRWSIFKVTKEGKYICESQLVKGRPVCCIYKWSPRSWTREYNLRRTNLPGGQSELWTSQISVPTYFSHFSLTAMLKWWKIKLCTNLSELLYLSEGRSSQRNLSLTSGIVPKLNEKHDGVSRQANEQSGMLPTKSLPRAVMFK